MFMARKDFKNRELENILKRNFCYREVDCFIIDRKGSKKSPLKASLQYGIDNGLLYREQEFDDIFFEDGMYLYRLTKKGKKYFGIII